MLFQLISGYVLLDLKGNAILIENFNIPHKFCQLIYSDIIETINRNIGSIHFRSISLLKIKNYFIHLRKAGNYILSVISKEDDPRIQLAIETALRKINSLDYTPNQIFSDVVAMRKTKKIINKVLENLPPSAKKLWILADKLLTESHKIERHKKWGINKLHLAQGRIGVEGLDLPKRKTKETIGDLIAMYMDGKFRDVLIRAPNLFYFGDSPRILYVLAALNLVSLDPKVKAPTLEEIKGVILNIHNPSIKEYLMLLLDSYVRPVSATHMKEILLKNKRKLLGMIENSDAETSCIYSLMIMRAPLRDVLGYLLKKFLEVSILMSTRVLSSIYKMEVAKCSPPKYDVWKKLLAKLYDGFKESIKHGGEIPFHHLFLVQQILLWALFIDELGIRHIARIFKAFIDKEKGYYGRLRTKSRDVPNDLKVENIDVTFNKLLNILIDILSEDESEKLIRAYEDDLLEMLKWLISLRYRRRIRTNIYQTTASSLIGLMSRISMKRGIYIDDIPHIIKEISTYCMDMHANYDLITYAEIYLGMSEAVGYMAMLLPEEERNPILDELCSLMKTFIDMLPEKNYTRSLMTVRTIEFLSVIGSEKSKQEAKNLLKSNRDILSTFFYEYCEKYVSLV